MKTANEIIAQSLCIFVQLDKTDPDYYVKLRAIVKISRRYLHNIARYYGEPYGSVTWQKIGDNPLPAAIYAK